MKLYGKAALDLRFSNLAIILSILGFTAVVLLFLCDDIIHWKDFSVWTATGGIEGHGDSDSTCLSRTYQHQYRASKVAPVLSPKLLESWGRYVQRHRSCTGAEHNWTRILEGSEESSSSCKYLVYLESGEGLGNRLLSLVSALLYGLITDRALMIDSRKDVAKVLCDPFEKSSWLLPNDFPYGVIETAPGLEEASKKNFSRVPVLHLELHHIQTGSQKLFFCDEQQESLEKVKVLAWSSNQYYVTSFFKIPALWGRLVSLFPSKLDVFQQLSQLAVSPSNLVWPWIARYYNGYLSCSKALVGVQVRTHGRQNLAEYDPVVHQIVLNCLTSHALLPSLSSHSSSSFTRSNHKADASVFVASLQGKYHEALRDAFLTNGTRDQRLVNFHTLSKERSEWHSLHQASLALAEMWLLSFSDQILTSEYSTFGYIASGVGGLRPWFVKIRGTGLKADADGCYRSHSTEPCTHFPQGPACARFPNITAQHAEWIQSRIVECQDHPGGLQLLN